MSSYRKLGIAILAASTISSLAIGGTSSAAETSGATPAANVSHVIASDDASAAVAYWTAERMASAKPADIAIADARVAAESRAPATVGEPVMVPPAAGALGAGSAAPAEVAGPDHASYVPRPYTNLPDRLTGKVFFTKQTGGNFVCSGTVVNSTNKSMIDTAGHCVSDGAGRFHRNWIFIPAYSSSCSGCADASYGTWTARTLTARTEWHSYSNFKQDLGYAVLNTLSGRRIVDYIGGQGSSFNQSRTQTWSAYGYPQASPFNGFDQLVCSSGRLGDDNPNPSRPGPATIRIHCNQTGGSSGGGWLIRQSGGLGYVNSHNSYRYGYYDDMYGPYFGSEALSLYDYTKNL